MSRTGFELPARLPLLRPMKAWSITTLGEKLIEISAQAVHHARYAVFKMAEVVVS